MEGKRTPTPAQIAAAFVEQYYLILSKSPENAHKFYQEPSLLGWPRADGVMTHVKTLSGINNKIMSSDYKNYTVEVETTDAQQSQDGGLMVVVTGIWTGKDSLKRRFSQTFFLAKQENGYFILNDIMRILDVCESRIEAATKNSVLVSAVRCDADADASRGPTSSNIKPSTQIVKAPSTVITPASHVVLKDTYASVVAKETPTISSSVATMKSKFAKQKVTSTTTTAPPVKVSSPSGGVSKAPISPSKVMPKSPTTRANIEAKGIYIAGLPYKITKQEIVDVVKQFGVVRRLTETVQIKRHKDGFCCGFVEFESASSARRAVEARYVMFGDKETYITYKR